MTAGEKGIGALLTLETSYVSLRGGALGEDVHTVARQHGVQVVLALSLIWTRFWRGVHTRSPRGSVVILGIELGKDKAGPVMDAKGLKRAVAKVTPVRSNRGMTGYAGIRGNVFLARRLSPVL